jgi:hypothetical protein
VYGIRKYRKLIKAIRDYLKHKLPSYSIPAGLYEHAPINEIN